MVTPRGRAGSAGIRPNPRRNYTERIIEMMFARQGEQLAAIQRSNEDAERRTNILDRAVKTFMRRFGYSERDLNE